jgi:hypothetical protein
VASYSRTSKSYARAKPDCYGDPDYYESDDPDCEACPVKRTCRAIVNRKEARREEEEATERKYKKAKKKRIDPDPDPEDYEEREEAIAGGFFGALIFNGALSATRAGMVEATFAIDQIPRAPYPDPFESITKKRKKED